MYRKKLVTSAFISWKCPLEQLLAFLVFRVHDNYHFRGTTPGELLLVSQICASYQVSFGFCDYEYFICYDFDIMTESWPIPSSGRSAKCCSFTSGCSPSLPSLDDFGIINFFLYIWGMKSRKLLSKCLFVSVWEKKMRSSKI